MFKHLENCGPAVAVLSLAFWLSYARVVAEGVSRAVSFEPALTLPSGTGPTPVAFADLDNDGKLDLVIGNDLDHSIWIQRNLGSQGGTLQTHGCRSRWRRSTGI